VLITFFSFANYWDATGAVVDALFCLIGYYFFFVLFRRAWRLW